MTMKKWVTLAVLILVVAAGAYWVFHSGKVSANISDKDLITAQRVDFPLIVSATGTLEATRSVSITPPQVRNQSRFKLTRMVDEGTVVSEGDFVMEFDTSDIARLLSCRESTVRNHLFQARKLLQEEIRQRFPEYLPLRRREDVCQ